MRTGLILILIIFLSGITSAEDHTKNIIESFEIFAHNTKVTWGSFLSTVYHQEQYEVPALCFSDHFIDRSHWLLAKAMKTVRNLFSEKYADELMDAWNEYTEHWINDCKVQDYVDDLDEFCKSHDCDPNTVMGRYWAHESEIYEILEDMAGVDGETDKSYVTIGEGVGKIFNIIFDNEDKAKLETSSLIKSALSN